MSFVVFAQKHFGGVSIAVIYFDGPNHKRQGFIEVVDDLNMVTYF